MLKLKLKTTESSVTVVSSVIDVSSVTAVSSVIAVSSVTAGSRQSYLFDETKKIDFTKRNLNKIQITEIKY